MLTTARVEIPAPVEARLKTEAAYSDNVNDYAREDLVGFRRPIAAAFALTAPISFAFAYQAGGIFGMAQTAFVVAGLVLGGLYLVGRQEWPTIVARFQNHATAKKKAAADLRCGFGESSFLSNGRSPRYYEYDGGVIVLADAGDLKTLFLDIDSTGHDARWGLYANGELDRRVWRWLRLPISREIVKFSTEGSKLARNVAPRHIRTIDAYEAVNVALGEPLDGAIIHRPFDELTEALDRMV